MLTMLGGFLHETSKRLTSQWNGNQNERRENIEGKKRVRPAPKKQHAHQQTTAVQDRLTFNG